MKGVVSAGPPPTAIEFGAMHLVGRLSNPYTAQSRHGSSPGARPRCSVQARYSGGTCAFTCEAEPWYRRLPSRQPAFMKNWMLSLLTPL